MRKYYPIIICGLIISLVTPVEIYAAKRSSKKRHTVTAKAAIFSDSTKVKRLYGKDVHTRVLPASTTKVMTALLALERLPMSKIVKVSKNATRVQPSKIYVKPNEKYKTSDLLYAVLLSSANDASVVLAEAVAGSEEKFVNLMNKKARALGCKNTKFANSHGLPSKQSQYTTPYDMYLIFREALKHRFFKKAVRNKYKTIRSRAGRKISLKSHNKILWKDWHRKVYGKTGYTRKAKSCFVGYLTKGRSTLIIAIFGCTKRWEDIKHIISKYGGVSL